MFLWTLDMTVLHSQVSSTFWMFSTSDSVSGVALDRECLRDRIRTAYHVFFKRFVVLPFACAFTKENLITLIKADQIFHIYYRTRYRLSNTDSHPHPSSKILPHHQPADCSRQEKFVYIFPYVMLLFT